MVPFLALANPPRSVVGPNQYEQVVVIGGQLHALQVGRMGVGVAGWVGMGGRQALPVAELSVDDDLGPRYDVKRSRSAGGRGHGENGGQQMGDHGELPGMGLFPSPPQAGGYTG